MNYLKIWWLFFVSDIQDYFEYILKKHGEKKTDNCSIGIYGNIKRITLEIKTGYDLDLLTLEKMKLLGSTKCKTLGRTKSKTTKVKNGQNVPHL